MAGLLKAHGCGLKTSEPPEVQEAEWPGVRARRLKKFKHRDKTAADHINSFSGSTGSYLTAEGDVVRLILDGGRSPDQSDGRLRDVLSAELRDARHGCRERDNVFQSVT